MDPYLKNDEPEEFDESSLEQDVAGTFAINLNLKISKLNKDTPLSNSATYRGEGEAILKELAMVSNDKPVVFNSEYRRQFYKTVVKTSQEILDGDKETIKYILSIADKFRKVENKEKKTGIDSGAFVEQRKFDSDEDELEFLRKYNTKIMH